MKNLNYRKDHGPIDPAKLGKFLEDAYLARRREGPTKKRSFSPSGIGYGHGVCPRFHFYQFTGYDAVNKDTAASMANMDHGIASHDRMFKLMRESGLNIVEFERKVVSEDPPIWGSIDVVIDRAGEEVIAEFKTARKESWIHRQSSMEPLDYHLIQLLIYMELEKARYGFFLYENKNDQSLLIIPVALEDHRVLVDRTLQWMRDVYAAFQAGTLPTRPFKKNSKICKNCPAFEVCWSGDKGDVDIEALSLHGVQQGVQTQDA